MKNLKFKLLLLFVVVFAFGLSGCIPEEAIKNPRLELELMQPTPTGGYIKAKGIADIDLTNVSNNWVAKSKGESSIKQNSHFVSRFKLDYPNGNQVKQNVKLVISANTIKIPLIGIDPFDGYEFIETQDVIIKNDNFTRYVYGYGILRGGDTSTIIFFGDSGSIRSDLNTVTPIYVSLENEEGIIVNGSVNINLQQ